MFEVVSYGAEASCVQAPEHSIKFATLNPKPFTATKNLFRKPLPASLIASSHRRASAEPEVTDTASPKKSEFSSQPDDDDVY